MALFTVILKPASGAFNFCALDKNLTFCLSFSHLWSGDKIVSRDPEKRVTVRSQRQLTLSVLGLTKAYPLALALISSFTRHSALEPRSFDIQRCNQHSAWARSGEGSAQHSWAGSV